MIGRWDAPASLVAELVAEHPERDVRRAAHDLAEYTANHDCTAPERMLRERITWARYARPGEPDDDTPGMFRFDGSWATNGRGDPGTHRFVDMLVTARQRGYEHKRIAERILREPRSERAFPNAATWLTAKDWWHCPAATSAEQAVLDAGHGCGESVSHEDADEGMLPPLTLVEYAEPEPPQLASRAPEFAW